MTTDPLARLLSRADAAAAPIAAPAHDLARQIRAELRRRQSRRQMTAAGVMAVALLASAILVPLARHARPATSGNVAVVTPTTRTDSGEIARLRNEIAILNAQANAAEATVAAMLQAEQRTRRVAPPQPPADPAQRIRDQQDLAALALIRHGDRLYRELDRKQSATTAYKRVVDLFPQTPSATTARHRLIEIKG